DTAGSGMVRDSIGPLNQWPRGQLILAHSSGPSVERMTYRAPTSAGSPHRAAGLLPTYAGQSKNPVLPALTPSSFECACTSHRARGFALDSADAAGPDKPQR